MHARHPFTAVERYSATARLFHWLTALLVVVAYIVSVGGPETRVYSAVNDFSRGSHELLGMSVFTLTLVRLCWRTIFPSPKSPEMPAWMEVGAKLGQWALYALLVLVPVTAVVGAWLEGHPLTLLAVGNIQPWLGIIFCCRMRAATLLIRDFFGARPAHQARMAVISFDTTRLRVESICFLALPGELLLDGPR